MRDLEEKTNNYKNNMPKLYDMGDRWGVYGSNSGGGYSVTFMGENPFNDPGKFGETEKSLLEKIGKAAEESSEYYEIFHDMVGKRKHPPQVLVVGPNFLVTPRPGVAVVSVQEKPKTF